MSAAAATTELARSAWVLSPTGTTAGGLSHARFGRNNSAFLLGETLCFGSDQ